MTHPQTDTGLLLFAHGARDPQWARPFQAVADRCRAVRGDDRVPLFLGAGGHVRKDIPVLLARLQADHPQVRFTLRQAIGEADAVVAAMADVALAGNAVQVPVR
ncbi:MAG: cobalamin biosynthesis protein CbiX [Burkholderiales bacterium PBB5]|nr:MAG: cobalamin biosynthesis protein CbiX [Burkholderiales bacterium PBB5]